MWPGVWEEQQEPRVSLPIPKLWESKPHSGWWKLGHRLLLLLVNGCDQCAPPATQKVHLPPSTKGPTFSPKVNWETKFVLQCGDVQEPECGDSLVGGGGMRLAYCAIMRPEKHAIGCTRCAAHTHNMNGQFRRTERVTLVKIFLSAAKKSAATSCILEQIRPNDPKKGKPCCHF